MPAHRHTRRRPGESRAFHFVSSWSVEAPVETVWDLLADVDGWPQWWPGIGSARSSAPEQGAPTDAADTVVRSPLGYRLRFTLTSTRLEPPCRTAFAVTGDLRGRGFWAAEVTGDRTVMHIGWCVVSDRRSVRLLGPLAPWAHTRIMAAGESGLSRRLRSRRPADGNTR